MMIQNIYGLADTFGLRNDVDFIPNRNQLNILILAPYFQFNHFVRFFLFLFFLCLILFIWNLNCVVNVCHRSGCLRERESVNTRKRTHINLAIVFFSPSFASSLFVCCCLCVRIKYFKCVNNSNG